MVYFWESFLGESRNETEDDFKWSICEYCGLKDVSIRKGLIRNFSHFTVLFIV